MATMAELLNYKEQQRQATQHAVIRKSLSESQRQVISDMNEQVRVCRLETQRKIDNELRNEAIRKNALTQLRTLRRDRDTIIMSLIKHEQFVNDECENQRILTLSKLDDLTCQRNNKTVAKPGQAAAVSELRRRLDNNFMDDKATLTNDNGDSFASLRSNLTSVNNKIDYYTNTLRGNAAPRPLPPRVERDKLIVELIPIVNDESLWTDNNEAELAELYQSLVDRIYTLNESVRPANGYPARPHTPISKVYNTSTVNAPRHTLDVTKLKNELYALCQHYNRMFDREGESVRVQRIGNHLDYLNRKASFLSLDRQIIKRGRHYYRLNPAPCSTRS